MRQGGATKVRVHHYTGGVDNSSQASSATLAELGADCVNDGTSAGLSVTLAVEKLFPEKIQCLSHRLEYFGARMVIQQKSHLWPFQQPVNFRDVF